MGKVFEALGDPVRRIVLELLAGGEQPAVSQHLKVLREAGLVRMRADGTRRLYALDPAGVDAARAWLAGLADPLEPFDQPLDALATEVARGRRSRHAGADRAAPGSAAPDSRLA